MPVVNAIAVAVVEEIYEEWGHQSRARVSRRGVPLVVEGVDVHGLPEVIEQVLQSDGLILQNGLQQHLAHHVVYALEEVVSGADDVLTHSDGSHLHM